MNWRLMYHNLFNLKFACAAAVFQAIIACCVNWEHGVGLATSAAFAQACASFLSTGVSARLVQHFSPIRNAFRSYFLGSLAAGSLTFAMSFTGHWWNDSPELLMSCVSPVFFSYTSSYLTNYVTRRGYLRPINYPKEVPGQVP